MRRSNKMEGYDVPGCLARRPDARLRANPPGESTRSFIHSNAQVKAPHYDRPEYHLEDFARPLVSSLARLRD